MSSVVIGLPGNPAGTKLGHRSSQLEFPVERVCSTLSMDESTIVVFPAPLPIAGILYYMTKSSNPNEKDLIV